LEATRATVYDNKERS